MGQVGEGGRKKSRPRVRLGSLVPMIEGAP